MTFLGLDDTSGLDLDFFLTVLHLASFAQVGVVARLYLGKLFGGSCQYPNFQGPWAWVPCVTSPGLTRLGGALFQDMPANVLGSLAIGLFSSGEALEDNYPGTGAKGPALAMLPLSSSLQLHKALHIGLRTGFCGSLTTYASWMLQMVEMFVSGGPSTVGAEWVAALWGLVVNVAMSMAALVVGQHLALGLQAAYVAVARGKAEALAEAVEYGGQGGATAAQGSGVGVVPAAAAEGAAADGTGEGKQDDGGGARQVTLVLGDAAEQAATVAATGSQGALQQQQGAGHEPEPRAGRSALCWAADAVVLLVFVFLTAISITYAVLEGEGTQEEQEQKNDLRNIWFAVLLGPPGCLLRWRLSRLNGQYSWWPMGTFAANVIACVIDFVVQSIIVRVPTLTLTQTSVMTAILEGISGCLSTVSTWVVEIQTLNRRLPDNWHGYGYALGSMTTTVALGLIIYGTSVWTL